jgi:hypothetical protein
VRLAMFLSFPRQFGRGNRAEIFRIPTFVCFQGDRENNFFFWGGGELRMLTVKCQQMAGT